MSSSRSILLLILLCFCAIPTAQAASVRPHGIPMSGVIRTVDAAARRLVFVQEGGTVHEVRWLRSTKFRNGEGRMSSADLRSGMQVKVLFHDPIFGSSYLSSIACLE